MRSILQRTPALATDPVFRRKLQPPVYPYPLTPTPIPELLENPNSALSDPDIVNRLEYTH